jgi:hypothetical protein
MCLFQVKSQIKLEQEMRIGQEMQHINFLLAYSIIDIYPSILKYNCHNLINRLIQKIIQVSSFFLLRTTIVGILTLIYPFTYSQ